MNQDIKFTKSEANALRNITKILICYMNYKYEKLKDVEQYVEAKVLVHIHQALDEGERQFGFSPNIKEYLIHVIQFWYKGVGLAVYNSPELKGTARETYVKHYNLVPNIIKKLENGI